MYHSDYFATCGTKARPQQSTGLRVVVAKDSADLALKPVFRERQICAALWQLFRFSRPTLQPRVDARLGASIGDGVTG